MNELEKRENINDQIVFWKLRLADTQREHIKLLIVDVNNVDTWAKNLQSSATQMAFYWKEIKDLQAKLLKGEN